MKKIILLIVVVTLLASCSREVSDPEVAIETSVGQEFKVVVESNPSTGYHWELTEELDRSIVEFVSRDYRADQPVQPGSGGSDIFTFKAIAAGETTITLGQYPPSNETTEPAQTKTFTVIVK